MKILITGASGFIGKNLTKFLQKDFNVTCISAQAASAEEIECDLADSGKILSAIEAKKIKSVDAIVHLASVTSTQVNQGDVSILNENNVLSQNAAMLCRHLNSKKIINLSSSSVYPNIDGVFTEESPINPSLNPDGIYGLSKFNSEVILNKLCPPETLISHLRCVMIHGEGVHPTRLWPVMEKELSEKNSITVFGNGIRLINQMSISFFQNAVKQFLVKDYRGVYNISEETLSLNDLAARIIREKGNKDSKIIKVDKGNVYQFRVNTDKYKNLK